MLISAPHPAADRHALIAQARQSLLSDSAAPVRAEVEPWIARSWQRCLARSLEPTRRVAFDAVSATALRLVTRAMLVAGGLLFVNPTLLTDAAALALIAAEVVIDRAVLPKVQRRMPLKAAAGVNRSH